MIRRVDSKLVSTECMVVESLIEEILSGVLPQKIVVVVTSQVVPLNRDGEWWWVGMGGCWCALKFGELLPMGIHQEYLSCLVPDGFDVYGASERELPTTAEIADVFSDAGRMGQVLFAGEVKLWNQGILPERASKLVKLHLDLNYQ